MNHDTNWWDGNMGWIVTAIIALGSAVFTFIKRFLSMPGREEFQKAHDSNTSKLDDILTRVGKVETDVAYIKGRMRHQ